MAVDLNIAVNGETANPLQRLINEVDIIMMNADDWLITNNDSGQSLQEYLFKSGLSETSIARDIQSRLDANISKDSGFKVIVECSFINLNAHKDMLYINVILTNQVAHRKLTYTIQ
jgi:hypothetical protein